MNTKTKEVNVDDYLNNADKSGSGANKSTTQSTKKSNDTWIEDDDVKGIFEVENGTKASKPKQVKKKVESKGWGKEPEEPEKQEPVVEIQTTDTTAKPKPKLFVKPNPDSKSTPSVSVDEGDFPVIGGEVKSSAKQTAESSQQQSQNPTGPRKFVNAKKSNHGESFAPIDPTAAKEPEVQPPKIVVGEKFNQKPAAPQETPVDPKFKFSEGPKKFLSSQKGSQKEKEETKSEQELLREQKEREIEERLRKQKEEEQARKAKIESKKNSTTPQKQEQEQPEKEEDSEWKTTIHEHKKSEKKEESKHDGPHPEFRNAKKHQKNNQQEPSVQPTEPKENKELKENKEDESAKIKETIQVNSELSSNNWGEGGIIKKSKKKV